MDQVKNGIKIGDKVKIKRGYCGSGYSFRVKCFGKDGIIPDTTLVYGTNNYGPVLLGEIEKVNSQALGNRGAQGE